MAKDKGELPKELKAYVCLFKFKNHRTYRIMCAPTVAVIEQQLKTQIGKNEVTEKKFFEIDRLTGSFEEF